MVGGTYRQLLTSFLDLLDLGVGKSLDFEKSPSSSSYQTLQWMTVSRLLDLLGGLGKRTATVWMLFALSLAMSVAPMPADVSDSIAFDGQLTYHVLATRQYR